MSDYTYIAPEIQYTASDWQRVLDLTTQPKRLIICEKDPIQLVSIVIEQLSHNELKVFVDELVYRTKLFF